MFFSSVSLTFPSGMSGIERSGRALFTLFLKRSTKYDLGKETAYRYTHTVKQVDTIRESRTRQIQHILIDVNES